MSEKHLARLVMTNVKIFLLFNNRRVYIILCIFNYSNEKYAKIFPKQKNYCTAGGEPVSQSWDQSRVLLYIIICIVSTRRPALRSNTDRHVYVEVEKQRHNILEKNIRKLGRWTWMVKQSNEPLLYTTRVCFWI